MAQVTRTSAPARSEIDRVARLALPAVGRLMLSAIFLMSGVTKFINWDQTAGHMTSMGMPLANVLLPAAALVEILGGLSILLGLRARVGAFVLFLFLIPTTLLFHNFWAAPEAQYQNQMIHFMKNAAIMGGLLVVAGLGAGPLSIDRGAGHLGTDH